MCQSTLQSYLVYKHLFFLDLNWNPRSYGVFCLECTHNSILYHIYIYIYVHTHIIYLYVCVCVYIYIYIYTYIYLTKTAILTSKQRNVYCKLYNALRFSLLR